MSAGEWWRRALLWIRRDRALAELEEEMRFHRDARAGQFVERGMLAEDAAHQAQRAFGNNGTHAEAIRDAWGWQLIDTFWQDVRFAYRRLLQRPGFAVAIIGILALGIGATTAMFSAVDAAMLRPLPFPRASELMVLPSVAIPFEGRASTAPGANHQLTFDDVSGMRSIFSHVSAWAAGGLNLADPDHPRRLNVGVVTADFFNTLEVAPVLGRAFAPEDGAPHGGQVAVLSYALWRDQFGGRAMLGQNIQLNNTTYQVVGVMPKGLSFPNASDLWIPMSVPTTSETFQAFRGYLSSQVLVRVVPGNTPDAINQQVLARWRLGLATNPVDQKRSPLPRTIANLAARGAAIPLRQFLLGDRRSALMLLLGATVMLLLIGCANITNLLLSQAQQRRREVAVRAALGATRARVIRQLITESVLLSLAGATLGLVIAPLSIGLLRSLMPPQLAGVADMHLDLRVLAFAAAIGIASGVVFGAWPARGSSQGLSEAIKSGGGHGASSSGGVRARRVLVGVESALTVILVIGAVLMLRSFANVMGHEEGLRTDQVGTLEMAFPLDSAMASMQQRIINPIVQNLAARPGVSAVGVINAVPLSGAGGILSDIIPDGITLPKAERVGPLLLYASPGYFRAMGIPLVSGRTFAAGDDRTAPRVAIINETTARLYWPGVNPVGRTFADDPSGPHLTVIGVVRDVRESDLTVEPLPQLYYSIAAQLPSTIALVARGSIPGPALLTLMRQAVRDISPSQAVFHLRTMDDVIGTQVAPRRTNTILITLFASLALLLASIGVYAVVAGGMAQRAREFGIRTALGATGRDIVTFVGLEMLATVLTGIGIGVAAAWMLVKLETKLVYGVSLHDTATFIVVPLALLVPAAAATLIPAWRGFRVNPADVMRLE